MAPLQGETSRKFEWIEAMRGLAALWVVCYHANTAVRDFILPTGLGIPLFNNGFLGVDFFFVLSGFIIATSSRRLLEGGQGLREYLTARLLRIYVPYLPISIAMLIVYAAFPTLSRAGDVDISFLSSLTLLPAEGRPALSVAWTLVHEMLFYLLFSVYFVSRPLLAVAIGIWTAAIAWAWLIGLPLSPLLRYFLSPLNLCFVLGILTSAATRRGVSNALAMSIGLAGILLIGAQSVSAVPNRIAVAIGFAALVAASCAPRAIAVTPGRILLTLGAASYSVYLVHNTALSAAVRILQPVEVPGAVFIGIAGTAVAAGLTYHFLYERRALRWARSRFRSDRSLPVRTA